MFSYRSAIWLIATVPIVSPACSDKATTTSGGGMEAAAGVADSGADASPDAPLDSVVDAPADHAVDGPTDGTVDAGPDRAGALHRWSKSFGGVGHQHAYDVVTDHEGNMIVGGHFAEAIDFGGDRLVCTDSEDVFVAKLDPEGNHIWSRSFGGPDVQRLLRLNVDRSGNVFMTGLAYGSVNFGGDTFAPEDPAGAGAFVVKLDGDGTHVWSAVFGAFAAGYDLAIDEQGDVFVTGLFSEKIDFGCGEHGTAGDANVFVVKLTNDGACAWSKAAGDTSNQLGRAITLDSKGHPILAGNIDGVLDFGSGPIESVGDTDAFMAKMDSATADVIWVRRWGDELRQGVRDVDASEGSICLTGLFDGSIDFDGEPLSNPGAPLQSGDAYVALFGEDGQVVWAKSFGGDGIQASFACMVMDGGDVLITGGFENATDFGCGPHASKAWGDVFVARLSAQDGSCVGSNAWGGARDDMGFAITVLSDSLIVVGDIGAEVEFGGGPIGGRGGVDAFVASFAYSPHER